MPYFNVDPIYPGFDAELSVQYSAEFAEAQSLATGTIAAQIRATEDSDTVLFDATTDGSTLIRTINDDNSVTLTINVPLATTTAWSALEQVVFDFVRVDGSAKRIVSGGVWIWPIDRAVSRSV